MSEVHKAITAHSKQQHEVVQTFLQLDSQREYLIDEVVGLCRQQKPFDINQLNIVTKQINDLAGRYGYVPARKLVTKEMVIEYANRLMSQKNEEI